MRGVDPSRGTAASGTTAGRDTTASGFGIGVALAAALTAGSAAAESALLTPADFEGVADGRERSTALFEEMGKVLTHPRCMNCHPRDDRPRQGNDMAAHQPPVVRGAGGLGAPGMRCSTCHGAGNVAYATADSGSIPGHEVWLLAPASMGWIGASLGEICEQIKDPDRNGGKTLEELHEHNAEDGLVGWGWEPGDGREPAPGSQAVFGQLTRAWIDSGAHCPG